jgi:hypothetical protein
MRYGVLAVVLMSVVTLGGCSEGVLDPPLARAVGYHRSHRRTPPA